MLIGLFFFAFIDGLVRVALARAVYAKTKYVLLDDPLSAVVCLSSSHKSSDLIPFF